LHFASNNDAKKRLIKMGEEKHRIFNTGAPQIDDMKKNKFKDEYIKKYFNIDTKRSFILVAMHPVTEEYGQAENQVKILIDSLNSVKQKKIWILPNIDAGADLIRKTLIENRNSDTLIFKNLSRPVLEPVDNLYNIFLSIPAFSITLSLPSSLINSLI